MRRAHLREAVSKQLFHFRKHIAPPAEEASCSTTSNPSFSTAGAGSAAKMTNTERDIAAAIAGVNSPCKSEVKHRD